MQVTEDIKEKFNTWWPHFLPFITSSKWDQLFSTLKDRSKAGAKICPLSTNTFNAFKECPVTELKVIIAGDCPYSKWDEKRETHHTKQKRQCRQRPTDSW